MDSGHSPSHWEAKELCQALVCASLVESRRTSVCLSNNFDVPAQIRAPVIWVFNCPDIVLPNTLDAVGGAFDPRRLYQIQVPTQSASHIIVHFHPYLHDR